MGRHVVFVTRAGREHHPGVLPARGHDGDLEAGERSDAAGQSVVNAESDYDPGDWQRCFQRNDEYVIGGSIQYRGCFDLAEMMQREHRGADGICNQLAVEIHQRGDVGIDAGTVVLQHGADGLLVARCHRFFQTEIQGHDLDAGTQLFAVTRQVFGDDFAARDERFPRRRVHVGFDGLHDGEHRDELGNGQGHDGQQHQLTAKTCVQ